MTQFTQQSEETIKKMRVAGKLVAATLEMIEAHISPGITTNELNRICEDFMVSHDAIPAPLGEGFPKATCTSVNNVVCHGIRDDKPLKEGSILNIDISLAKDGAYADSCKMYFVGEPSIIGK